MVIMMVGEGITHMPATQVFKALFGYLIGLETALGSYVFGRTVASWLHNWRNPVLAQEREAMKLRKSHGIFINHTLPEFERRYLPELPMAGVVPKDDDDNIPPALSSLARWRASTKESRRLESDSANVLKEVETAVFFDKRPIFSDMEEVARKHNWDIDALKEWVSSSPIELLDDEGGQPLLSSDGVRRLVNEDGSIWLTLPVAASVLGILLVILAIALVVLDGQNKYSITDRTMIYAMLFAAPGVLLRWKLGGLLNGKLPVAGYSWFPAGTLAANVIACMVSISTIAIEYLLSDSTGFWTIGTVRAIRVGFAGCLSTVSTFISEVHNLTHKGKQDRGYKYIIASLAMSAVLSIFIFCIIVYI
jgi:fluoride ion exporter CrcB/FEX